MCMMTPSGVAFYRFNMPESFTISLMPEKGEKEEETDSSNSTNNNVIIFLLETHTG